MILVYFDAVRSWVEVSGWGVPQVTPCDSPVSRLSVMAAGLSVRDFDSYLRANADRIPNYGGAPPRRRGHLHGVRGIRVQPGRQQTHGQEAADALESPRCAPAPPTTRCASRMIRTTPSVAFRRGVPAGRAGGRWSRSMVTACRLTRTAISSIRRMLDPQAATTSLEIRPELESLTTGAESAADVTIRGGWRNRRRGPEGGEH